MGKYDVRPTEREDLVILTTDTPEAHLWGYMDDVKIHALLNANSWTGLYDGQIVACGGIVRIWPGLAEAWIAVTPRARQHTHFVARTAHAALDAARHTYSLRRIEAHVRTDFALACRFVTWLGFDFEATLRKYGPNGESFSLYAKVM